MKTQKYYYIKDTWTGKRIRVWFEKDIATIGRGKSKRQVLNLSLWSNEGQYCDVTIDFQPCFIASKPKLNRAYIDTNNSRWLFHWLIKRKIAKPTYFSHFSGFCEYPEMEFDEAFLESLS